MNLIMTLERFLETLAGVCRDIYINDQSKHEGFLLGSLNSLGVIYVHPEYEICTPASVEEKLLIETLKTVTYCRRHHKVACA